VTAPCRTFQQAYNTVAANGEIDALDPAGYGPLTITHGISIQAHGFGGISQPASNGTAITVSVTTSDPVTLNGLLIDGSGTGQNGIYITSGPSVQILNSVLRNFFGAAINDASSTNQSNLLVEDTILSDSGNGIVINPQGGEFANVNVTLNRIAANNNQYGVFADGGITMIANSVISNNFQTGVNNNSSRALVLLAKNVINRNGLGVGGSASAVVGTYGDNYINDAILAGILTPFTTR
jgi:hypothetical protein